jgi:hypothetical protein
MVDDMVVRNGNFSRTRKIGHAVQRVAHVKDNSELENEENKRIYKDQLGNIFDIIYGFYYEIAADEGASDQRSSWSDLSNRRTESTGSAFRKQSLKRR